MTARTMAGFEGEARSFERLAELWPTLAVEITHDATMLSGPPVDLGVDKADFAERIERFVNRANVLLGVAEVFPCPIRSTGRVVVVRPDGHRDSYLLAPTGHFEVVTYPVTLTAVGGTRSPTRRPFAERVDEMSVKHDRFARASNYLAHGGEDFGELYMAVELIEKAHGRFPKKTDRAGRLAFAEAIQISEEDWAALHRSARPARHPEPHADPGPTVTARQARAVIHHALKLWLEREVPV